MAMILSRMSKFSKAPYKVIPGALVTFYKQRVFTTGISIISTSFKLLLKKRIRVLAMCQPVKKIDNVFKQRIQVRIQVPVPFCMSERPSCNFYTKIS